MLLLCNPATVPEEGIYGELFASCFLSYKVTKPQLTSAFRSREMTNSYGVFTVGQILKHFSYKYM